MKHGLARETQRGAFEVHARNLQALERHHVREPGLGCGARFLIQEIHLVGLRAEQHAVQPFEVTVDLVLAHDALDEIDGGPVTVGRQSRAVGAEKLREVHEPVVEHRRQVRSGASRFTCADAECVDELHIVTLTPQ